MLRTSSTILTIAPALAEAQAKINAARKDSKNPHFNSKYADLASVWDAFREPFAEHKLAVVQSTKVDGNHMILTTRILHGSGEWIEGDIEAVAKDASPQSIGSCSTYLRRYGASALIGIVSEDDDGNAATASNPQRVSRGAQERQQAAQRVASTRQAVDARAGHGQEDTDALRQPPAKQEVKDDTPKLTDDEAKAACDALAKGMAKHGKLIASAVWYGAKAATYQEMATRLAAAGQALDKIMRVLPDGRDVIDFLVQDVPEKMDKETGARVYAALMKTANGVAEPAQAGV